MVSRAGAPLRLRHALLGGYFFERVDHLGVWRIPREGPAILAARMGDPLLDALLLQSAMPRPLHLVVETGGRSRILERWLGVSMMVLPYATAGDRHAAAKHEEILVRCAHLLADGEVVAILAGEGQRRGVEVPSLEALASRMALKASSLAETPAIVPVVQIYARRAVLRCKAEVIFGEPLRMPWARSGGMFPLERELADLLGKALQGAATPPVPWSDLEILERLRPMATENRAASAAKRTVSSAEREEFLERVHDRRLERPVQMRRLLSSARTYFEMVDGFGLQNPRRDSSAGRAEATSRAINRLILMVGGFPAAIYGLLFHAAPHTLSGWIAIRTSPWTSKPLALRRLTFGAILFPCIYALQGWALWRLLGDWRVVACLLAAPPAGLWWMGYGAAFRTFLKALRISWVHGWRDGLPGSLEKTKRALKSALEPLEDLYG